MSSSQAILADQKHHHNGSSSSNNNNNNNNSNKPTNDLAQIEKIKRIVERQILGNGRHLFPDGRWPTDGVGDPRKHPEPYTTSMKFGGRDPSNKKRPGLTKRPPNMWMIFRMHAASVVMEEFPEVNQAALTSVLAPIWQSVITPEEKDLVREESERLKEYHKMQFPDWKYKPRQKKRTGQQAQQQQSAGTTKRESQQISGAARHARQQQDQQHQQLQQQHLTHHQHLHQQQQQHQQQQHHHQHHHHHMMQDAVSPYLSSGSPDIDHIDGLQLPLSVDTSPQATVAPMSLMSGGSAAATTAAGAGCLPFSSPWANQSLGATMQIPLSLSNFLQSGTSTGYAVASSGSPPSSVATQQQHHQHNQHQQQHSSLKDPTLRSILAASAPSSVSSTIGGSGDLSCLPDLLPADYFNELALPDLEAYLSPEGCSGGPVSEPQQLQQQQQQQQQHQCDFTDPTELRHLVKQEFSYAVI